MSEQWCGVCKRTHSMETSGCPIQIQSCQRCAAKDKEIEALKAEIIEAQKYNLELERYGSELKAALAECRAENADLRQACEEKQQCLESEAAVRKDLHVYRDEYERLEADNKALHDLRKRLLERADEAEKNFHSVCNEVERLEAENSKLKELLKAKEDLVSHEGCLAENEKLKEALAAVLCFNGDFEYCDDNLVLTECIDSWARIVGSLEVEPWKNGQHSGDCTNQCHSCTRCLVEKYRGYVDEALARSTDKEGG